MGDRRYLIGQFEDFVMALLFGIAIVVTASLVSYNVGHKLGERMAADSIYVEQFLERADSIIVAVTRARIDRLLGQ